MVFHHLPTNHIFGRLGGGGVHAYHFGKNDFELGVKGEGQDRSRSFEGGFGSKMF